eukprot:6153941-Amphidinium_carterae.1
MAALLGVGITARPSYPNGNEGVEVANRLLSGGRASQGNKAPLASGWTSMPAERLRLGNGGRSTQLSQCSTPACSVWVEGCAPKGGGSNATLKD